MCTPWDVTDSRQEVRAQAKPFSVQAVKLRSWEGAVRDAGSVPSDNPSLGNNHQQLSSGCCELWTP